MAQRGARLAREVTIGGVVLALGAAIAAMIGSLAAQVVYVVRRNLPTVHGRDRSGPIGGTGEPLNVVALGDSTLTAPGIDDDDDVWLRRALRAAADGRAIDARFFAVGGSRVADVRREQLPLAEEAASEAAWDLAVVAVGGNDAIHGTRRRLFARDLADVVERLAACSRVVVLAGIGDLGNIRRVPAPLAHAMRKRARRFDRAIRAVASASPSVVYLDVTVTDDAFRAHPELFGPDWFHPSAAGHHEWARAAVPGLRVAFDSLRHHP